ncbi:tRNA lysidine(34) synthetase TilS [Litoreibacter halocynthiae]|uniref:tRNA lysidine(34) synthetase TilS n=1 Tax=Litoreibacter halocynthiae TaxID=1242689 RepID=UPI00248FAE18|nr:tRNA lysidine(34) synthetase TilS [Litoreibacter halocynthiae]
MTAAALPENFLTSIKPDSVLGVAVSGGGDSMALLYMLLQAGVPVRVATVNHNLRDEAGAEAQAVAAFCASHGVSHDVLHWHWDGTGNLQDQARRGRYRLLSEWAAEAGLGSVALGHTADDNIETFLMGLSRGAGLDGLSGMQPSFLRKGIAFHRPLLHARRSELREILQGAGISWFDDPSNDDSGYQRIKVRQSMSALEAAGIAAEQIEMSLGNLQATRRDLNAELAAEVEGHVRLDQGDLCFDLHWLEAKSPESQRRLLNSALQFVAGQDYPPRGAKMMRVLADLREKSVLHGCVITSDDAGLRVGRELNAVAELRVPSTEVWDQRWSVVGPHSKTTEIRALGEVGLAQCAVSWRDIGLPRASVLASPSVWEGDRLMAAPLAGWANNWSLTLRQHDCEYLEFVLSH